MVQLSSMQWEGPDLDGAGPILALAALRQFLDSYGTVLVATVGVLLLILVIFWIGLEALFRGGWKRLWVYVGTAVSRTVLLLGTAGIFLMLSRRDDSGGTLFIGVVVMIGVWFIVGLLETVVRRDAVDLVATSLAPLSAVMGCLLLSEGIVAFVLLGSAAVALQADPALAGLFVTMVLTLWLVVHSYLVAVRYSAIDIMRRNVFRV